ncbi:MAG: class I SAM-dependent rRNA methyltransferase [Planctomycetes bacterium]|nr:class I SAM-dependent rRNA methyltransferase [Planctomycetota bacterium]
MPDLPRAQLRSAAYHPFIYRKMIGRVDSSAHPGDLVAVYDPRGELFGYGLYNPRSQIALRMLSFERQPPDEAWWQGKLEHAVRLRRELLGLDAVTDAYRVVHAEGDGLSGLVVDRFGDTLSVEVFSLGVYQRLEHLLPALARLCGTRDHLVQVDARAAELEGIKLRIPHSAPSSSRHVEIREHGVRFRVYFEAGHKTGFFCDQRENRRRLAELCQGKRVLDLCCYTGGFGLYAKVLGGAAEVTGVDLDEKAIAVARENANLNQARLSLVHADVFPWMRDAVANGWQFEVVVLDPPKLIASRREIESGKRKYFDLNRLALGLVRPGGLFVTCSCSGLLSADEFVGLVRAAGRRLAAPEGALGSPPSALRPIQLLWQTGSGPDHPVALDCPETSYLKVLWLRVG